MDKRELRDLIETYVRGQMPRQAILTSLGDVAEALAEAGAALGFDKPGVRVRLDRVRSLDQPTPPPIALAGRRYWS